MGKCHEFFLPPFFHDFNPSGPFIHILKYFDIHMVLNLRRFSRVQKNSANVNVTVLRSQIQYVVSKFSKAFSPI